MTIRRQIVATIRPLSNHCLSRCPAHPCHCRTVIPAQAGIHSCRHVTKEKGNSYGSTRKSGIENTSSGGGRAGQGEAYSKNLCACAATQPTECRFGDFTCQLATCTLGSLHNQIQFCFHFSVLFRSYKFKVAISVYALQGTSTYPAYLLDSRTQTSLCSNHLITQRDK